MSSHGKPERGARASRDQRKGSPDGTHGAWSLPSPCATAPARRPGWGAWSASPPPAPRRCPRPLGSARPGCATSERTAAPGASSRPPRRPLPSAAAHSGFWVAVAGRPRAAPEPCPPTRPRSSRQGGDSARAALPRSLEPGGSPPTSRPPESRPLRCPLVSALQDPPPSLAQCCCCEATPCKGPLASSSTSTHLRSGLVLGVTLSLSSVNPT